ncbi:MAG: zinc-binding alcohol dehydrogenase family protein [Verrucomicrobia bacterium]|nr:MAG: zinc-binding alcohol dehydrogenase family protein [Verrucomicrobiota bacterium]TAE87168.1 MAG: zinc-binding alcohol dehydrogenase family protein [Verrucomicrobiota bacterium]TAF24972.1 MAG: zinc-binding alcohol dehydrogenase family protein [Verrucomicrobiota bacterium]TAF40701.1 MAG: zinc-binding alcohol dehydrogenase family protein [Verrucomicrobiota bacterium]
MKAIQFTNPGEIKVIELPSPPAPGPGEALVRTHRMGVCGTDLSGYLGKMPFFSYPRIPGHELGLEVLEVGEGVTNVKSGDRCSLEPYVNDPSSVTSLKGASNCCPGVQVLGVHQDGGLRESWIVPARKLHVGNDLSYDQLALVETLAIGYHAVQRGNPQPGETVLVIGAGPIGLACLEFLKLMDVKVVVMDMVQGRLDFCRDRLGLAHGILVKGDGSELAELEALGSGQLADVVIDATGSAISMSNCFQYAAFTGRVVYVGITTQELKFPHAPVFHRRELTLMASRNALPKDFGEIIRLIGEGKIDTDAWITHRLAFDEVAENFARFTDPKLGAIKVIIEL